MIEIFMIDFLLLAQQCAIGIEPDTMAAIVQVESSFNPYAIGVVGGKLERQPKNLDEAISTAKMLEENNWNFSVGLAQVNKHNFKTYHLTNYEIAFDPCENLKAGAAILAECYQRADKKIKTNTDPNHALKAAFSCYYSGNFQRGFIPDKNGQPSYVQKVMSKIDMPEIAIPISNPPNSSVENHPRDTIVFQYTEEIPTIVF